MMIEDVQEAERVLREVKEVRGFRQREHKSRLDQAAFEMDGTFTRRWKHPGEAQSWKEQSV